MAIVTYKTKFESQIIPQHFLKILRFIFTYRYLLPNYENQNFYKIIIN